MYKVTLACVGIVLTWMLVVPVFEFPDEQAHFETVSFVLEEDRVPTGSEKDMSQEMYETQQLLGVFRNPLGQNKYTYHPEYTVEYTDSSIGKYEKEIQAHNTREKRSTYVAKEAANYPELYYRYMSVVTAISHESDILTRLFVTRLGGLILVAVLSYTAYLIGTELFRDKRLAVLLPVVTILQPMMSFVTAGINSDNLHNVWFTIILYLSLKIIRYGISIRQLIALGIVVLLDINTKPQGFIALPIIGLALFMSLLIHRAWRTLIALLALGAVAIIGSYNQLQMYSGLLSVANDNGASFIEYLRFSSNKLIAQNIVWYWGVFKWLGVVLPPIYWRIANRVALLSVIGLIVYVVRVLKKKSVVSHLSSLMFLIGASILYAGVIFWYDWQYLKIEGFSLGIQARYFFPTIVAHMGIVITGILSLGWTKKVQNMLSMSIVLLFVWLQLGGIYRVVSVYYDVSDLARLTEQISQYKPFFAKGIWWYVWAGVYVTSMLTILKNVLSQGKQAKPKRGQK